VLAGMAYRDVPLPPERSTANLLRERGHNFEFELYEHKFLGSLLW